MYPNGKKRFSILTEKYYFLESLECCYLGKHPFPFHDPSDSLHGNSLIHQASIYRAHTLWGTGLGHGEKMDTRGPFSTGVKAHSISTPSLLPLVYLSQLLSLLFVSLIFFGVALLPRLSSNRTAPCPAVLRSVSWHSVQHLAHARDSIDASVSSGY